MSMTVRELIRQLEDHDGDTEVRIATQPNWPLAFDVANVVHEQDIMEGSDEDDEPLDDEPRDIVWIATSEGNCYDHPYAPRGVWGY